MAQQSCAERENMRARLRSARLPVVGQRGLLWAGWSAAVCVFASGLRAFGEPGTYYLSYRYSP